MSVVDKLKDRKALEEELKKQGLKIVDDDSDAVPQLEFTDEDMDDPKKLAAKVNSVLATVFKNSKAEAKKAKEEVEKTVTEKTAEAELQQIRAFLKSHKHTDKDANKDLLEQMDFYYAKGATVEEAYKKACKVFDLEPGVVGEEKKDKKDVKKEEKPKVKSEKSGEFSGKDEEESEEDSSDKKKKEPLSIREAAKQSLAKITASMKEAGEPDPFEDKGE